MIIREFTRLAAVVALVASCSIATAQNNNAQPAAAPQGQPNAIAKAGLNAGVQACAGRIHQVTEFVANNQPAGVYLFMPPSQPDQRVASISMEVRLPNANNAYVSASFAPNQANGCGALYEAVVYWPQKCADVASKQFSEMTKGKTLQKDIIVLENNTAARIFLMPAGSGCVSIKKEIVL